MPRFSLAPRDRHQPTSEEIVLVPDALAVAKKNEFDHELSLAGSRKALVRLTAIRSATRKVGDPFSLHFRFDASPTPVPLRINHGAFSATTTGEDSREFLPGPNRPDALKIWPWPRTKPRCCDNLGDFVFDNVNLRLGSMMLNGLDLLVHGRFLVMNDRLWLVFRHGLLVSTRARVRKTRSRALGRRRCDVEPDEEVRRA